MCLGGGRFGEPAPLSGRYPDGRVDEDKPVGPVKPIRYRQEISGQLQPHDPVRQPIPPPQPSDGGDPGAVVAGQGVPDAHHGQALGLAAGISRLRLPGGRAQMAASSWGTRFLSW